MHTHLMETTTRIWRLDGSSEAASTTDFLIGHCLKVFDHAKEENQRTPISYNYQWMRTGKAIPGADEQVYQLTSFDAGELMTCVETGNDKNERSITYPPSNTIVCEYETVNTVTCST